MTFSPGRSHGIDPLVRIRLLIIACLALGACSVREPHFEPSDTSLFSRLGGLEGLHLISGSAVESLVTDPSFSRANADTGGPIDSPPDLKLQLVRLLCLKTGGDCELVPAQPVSPSWSDAQKAVIHRAVMQSCQRFRVGNRELNELSAALGGVEAPQ